MLTYMHRNNGQGWLKAKIRLLPKVSAWGAPPSYNHPVRLLSVEAPAPFSFVHRGAQMPSGSFTGQSVGLPEMLKIRRDSSGTKRAIEVSPTNSPQMLTCAQAV